MPVETIPYGIADLKVARFNATDDYEAAVDVWGVTQFNVNVETESGRLLGDDVVLRAHARVIACQITARFAFKSLEAYEAMTGKTVVAGTSHEYLEISDDSFPYFGLVAQAKSDDGSGDTHIFAPMAKLMGGFQMQFQNGQFVTPELTIDCVKDETYGIVRIKQNENTTAIVIPPSFT